jgi:hypothetical protein
LKQYLVAHRKKYLAPPAPPPFYAFLLFFHNVSTCASQKQRKASYFIIQKTRYDQQRAKEKICVTPCCPQHHSALPTACVAGALFHTVSSHNISFFFFASLGCQPCVFLFKKVY